MSLKTTLDSKKGWIYPPNLKAWSSSLTKSMPSPKLYVFKIASWALKLKNKKSEKRNEKIYS